MTAEILDFRKAQDRRNQEAMDLKVTAMALCFDIESYPPYPFPFEAGNELPADCEPYVAPDSDPA